MARHQDHHAPIFVGPDIVGPIEAMRRTWDPVMASQIAAHVRVAYPREAPLVELLVDRVRLPSATVSAFRLRLGGVAHWGRPQDGVHIAVDDLDGGYRDLRDRILGPPFTPLEVAPHVIAAFDGTAWAVLETFPLRQTG
ncbi:MAG: hypothetical protein HY294_16855 [Candidatus Rokubacteria bacterium]|nr:hypothetical protein [Candidatus Rokubacteria bacterium]MBI3827663.1 hypothetical protein [Candidatus Rokubacteria bacterium]